MRRLLLATAVAALVLPGAALADATIVSRDVPLHGERAPEASTPSRFTLVGLHWQGSGRVEFRTRSVGGRWSAWLPAAPEGGTSIAHHAGGGPRKERAMARTLLTLALAGAVPAAAAVAQDEYRHGREGWSATECRGTHGRDG